MDEKKIEVVTPNPSQDDQKNGEKDYKALYEAEVAKNAQISADNAKQKNRIDELCSENKKYKDENYARLTQEEKDKIARQEQEARNKEIAEELAKYKRKDSYLSAGYTNDEIKLLEEKGETPSTFAEIMRNRENARLEQEKLKSINKTPTPQGNGKTEIDASKLTMSEWNELEKNNPELYKKLLNQL